MRPAHPHPANRHPAPRAHRHVDAGRISGALGTAAVATVLVLAGCTAGSTGAGPTASGSASPTPALTASTSPSVSASPTTSVSPTGPRASATAPTVSGVPASLFVLEADAGTAAAAGSGGAYELVLTGVDRVTSFADRPQRLVGAESATQFVQAWSSRGFAADPPIAALAIGAGDVAEVAVLSLTEPRLDPANATLRLRATLLDPAEAPPALAAQAAARPLTELPPRFDGAALYVDTSGTDDVVLVELRISGSAETDLSVDFDSTATVVLSGEDVEGAQVGTPGAGGLGIARLTSRSIAVTGMSEGTEGATVTIPLAVQGDAITGSTSGTTSPGATVTLSAAGGGTPVTLVVGQPFRVPLTR